MPLFLQRLLLYRDRYTQLQSGIEKILLVATFLFPVRAWYDSLRKMAWSQIWFERVLSAFVGFKSFSQLFIILNPRNPTKRSGRSVSNREAPRISDPNLHPSVDFAFAVDCEANLLSTRL